MPHPHPLLVVIVFSTLVSGTILYVMSMRHQYPALATLLLFILISVVLITVLTVGRSRAETMILERIVPPGAVITYSEGGSVVRTMVLPEGRARVTIEFVGRGETPPPHRRHTP
jgi:hypothetical protein